MQPFMQPTVFNWYLPDYAPNGPLSEQGLVAPEMQLANEQDMVRKINYLGALASGNTISMDSVASGGAQTELFNGDSRARNYNKLRFDWEKLTEEVYPPTAPTPTATETSEYLANIQMLDALDQRLTAGNLKRRYPIDPSDDGADGASATPES